MSQKKQFPSCHNAEEHSANKTKLSAKNSVWFFTHLPTYFIEFTFKALKQIFLLLLYINCSLTSFPALSLQFKNMKNTKVLLVECFSSRRIRLLFTLSMCRNFCPFDVSAAPLSIVVCFEQSQHVIKT